MTKQINPLSVLCGIVASQAGFFGERKLNLLQIKNLPIPLHVAQFILPLRDLTLENQTSVLKSKLTVKEAISATHCLIEMSPFGCHV